MAEKAEVWLDVGFWGGLQQVGTLSHERGQVWFVYEKNWLRHPARFLLDPVLTLDAAPFFPKSEAGNFGIFLDSSPDRWGRMLMQRRELLDAKDGKRQPKKLYAWDYLIGVQDETRQGALRFKKANEEKFLASDSFSVPPVTNLKELESVAFELTNKKIDDLSALKKWLSVLVAPGASLGGARPKANFRSPDGALWIAKFPAHDDDLDTGAWEAVAHNLAKQAGITVPEAKLAKLGKNHHTFCIKRFDRHKLDRVFYSSAMTLLQKEQSEGTSYLEIAYFLQTNGAAGFVKQDLEQLFRRVVFNMVIGNKDDHLRNHGFLLSPDGWRISPAFDVNPNPYKNEHVLNIDETDNRPNIETAFATAEWYGLDFGKAEQIVEEVVQVTRNWKDAAKKMHISSAQIEMMESAFLACDDLGGLVPSLKPKK